MINVMSMNQNDTVLARTRHTEQEDADFAFDLMLKAVHPRPSMWTLTINPNVMVASLPTGVFGRGGARCVRMEVDHA
jgi:hypothetical protein